MKLCWYATSFYICSVLKEVIKNVMQHKDAALRIPLVSARPARLNHLLVIQVKEWESKWWNSRKMS